MEYTIITRENSEEIKSNAGIEKEEFIYFNFSTAFFLKNNTIVVQPLNPFGKCLHIHNLIVFEKFIEQESFPVVESIDTLFSVNSDLISNIAKNKDGLINELYQFTQKKDRYDTLDINELETIFSILRTKKKMKKYKLHFLVLLTYFVLQSHKHYKWGILKKNQLINPIYEIVLVTDGNNERYFNIEQAIDNRLFSMGVQYIIERAFSSSKKSDELEKIVQIIDFD